MATEYEREETVETRRDRRGNLLLPLLAIVVLLLIAWVVWLLFRDAGVKNNNQYQNQNQSEFQTNINAGSFSRSLPAHAETVPAGPLNVLVMLNGTATRESSVTVKYNDVDYANGSTSIDANGQVLRRDLKDSLPDGIYTVSYRICGTDTKCQDGSYQFKVDSNARGGYQTLTGRNAITISMDSEGFNPANIIVNKGTRLTWRNNTKSNYSLYPGTEEVKKYYPNLNSGPIRENGTYTFTVTERGFVPYFAQDGRIIKGNIIVE